MARLPTCPICKLPVEKGQGEKVSGKTYHKEICLFKYQKEKEFRQSEYLKRDSLVRVIAEVHKMDSYQSIPRSFYPYIEEVRNDSKLFGKLRQNYKNGIPYEALEYTYKYCKDKIEWAINNKQFKNTTAELRYGLAIVKNNIADAKKHHAKTKKNTQQDNLTIQKANDSVIIQEKMKEVQRNNNKKSIKEGIDISELFD